MVVSERAGQPDDLLAEQQSVSASRASSSNRLFGVPMNPPLAVGNRVFGGDGVERRRLRRGPKTPPMKARAVILSAFSQTFSLSIARARALPSFFLRWRRAGGSSTSGVHSRKKVAEIMHARGVLVSASSVIVSCRPSREASTVSRTAGMV